jgi:hypothetical protein
VDEDRRPGDPLLRDLHDEPGSRAHPGVALRLLPAPARRVGDSLVVVYLLAVSSALSTLGFMVATGLRAVWRSLATSRAVDIVGVRGLVPPVASLVIAALGAAVLLPLFRSTPRLATTLFHLVPGVAAMLPFLVWRLLDEERCLARRLPGYADYQKQVRYRLVPFVW